MKILFRKVLNQTEIMQKLSNEMPHHEYMALTSQIVTLAEMDENSKCGHVLNLVA